MFKRAADRHLRKANPSRAWPPGRARAELPRCRLLPGFLSTVSEEDCPPKFAPDRPAVRPWLLRLSATNQADLQTVMDCTQRYWYDELIVASLATQRHELAPELQATLAKAYFNTDQMTLFANLWQRLRSRARPRSIPNCRCTTPPIRQGGMTAKRHQGQRQLDRAKRDRRLGSTPNDSSCA